MTPKRAAASSVTSVWRLLRPQRRRFAQHGAQHMQRLGRALAAPGEVLERDVVDGGLGAGEVGVDLVQVHVADDEQRRVLDRLAVVEQLAVGGTKVGVRALIFPAGDAAFPDVGGARAAGAGTLGASLEAVPLAGGVRVVGRRHAEHSAEVAEVLLRGGALTASVVLPLRGEVGGGERRPGGGHARSSLGSGGRG